MSDHAISGLARRLRTGLAIPVILVLPNVLCGSRLAVLTLSFDGKAELSESHDLGDFSLNVKNHSFACLSSNPCTSSREFQLMVSGADRKSTAAAPAL